MQDLSARERESRGTGFVQSDGARLFSRHLPSCPETGELWLTRGGFRGVDCFDCNFLMSSSFLGPICCPLFFTATFFVTEHWVGLKETYSQAMTRGPISPWALTKHTLLIPVLPDLTPFWPDFFTETWSRGWPILSLGLKWFPTAFRCVEVDVELSCLVDLVDFSSFSSVLIFLVEFCRFDFKFTYLI